MMSRLQCAFATAIVCLAPALDARAEPDNTAGMALMSASVTLSGVLSRGSGVTGVAKLGTGTYEVTFERDVTMCTYVSAVSDTGQGTVFGISTAVRRINEPNAIEVRTRSALELTQQDRPFHLLVFCAR